MNIQYWFDIGNTRGKFWITRDGVVALRGAIVHHGSVMTLVEALPQAFIAQPNEIFCVCVLGGAAIGEFEGECRRRWGVDPLVARSCASNAGVKNGYVDPTKLGVDRWLGVLAASPASGRVCVAMCGTALTLDILEEDEHVGGYIMPGLSLMAASLIERTKGVGCVGPNTDGLQPARNTSEAVARGGLLAAAGCIERVVRQFGASRVILAGGDASRLSGCLQMSHFVDPDLLLRGLQVYFGRLGCAHH